METVATHTAKKPLPRWVVLVAVLVSGGITAWAMWATGLRGPHESWDQAQGIVDQVWPGEHDSPRAQGRSSVDDASGSAARTVAALPGVPNIVWGAQRMHADRGACTNCHGVVSPQGLVVPSIRSFSPMPHEYRGVCVNCHSITLGPNPMGVAIAGTTAGAPAMQPWSASPAMPATPALLAAPVAVAPPPQPAQPTEAEWKGLEVAPSPQGVGVAGAEGDAARAGVLQGDVITSVNAAPVLCMGDFVRATQNGTLARGTLIVSRNGQRLAFELGQVPNVAPPVAPLLTGPSNPTAGMPIGGIGEKRF